MSHAQESHPWLEGEGEGADAGAGVEGDEEGMVMAVEAGGSEGFRDGEAPAGRGPGEVDDVKGAGAGGPVAFAAEAAEYALDSCIAMES